MSFDPGVQITRNCHYISRFLTRPWEDDQRRLHFYDFDKGEFDYKPSRKLFAEDKINTPKVESWLCETLETPLARARPRLLKADPAALDEWRFFRAAVLMLWLQGVRTRSVEDEGAKRDLDLIASLQTSELDALVADIQKDFEFRLIFTISHQDTYAPLFVPSTGIFDFSYPDAGTVGGHHRGIGMPIDQTCAFVATGAQKHGKIDFSLVPGSVANCSVGTSRSRRVVVPPSVLADERRSETRNALVNLRQANDELIGNVDRMKQIVEQGFAAVGLIPARDRAGRIVPGV